MEDRRKWNQAYNQRVEQTERNRNICKLHKEGWTMGQIGRYYGITRQAASKIYHRDKAKYEV